MEYLLIAILFCAALSVSADQSFKNAEYMQIAQVGEKTMSAIGDSKKEACEDAEWEARKACIRIGTGGIPANGAQCISCTQYNAYQYQCTVAYRCK